jgi:histone H2A
MVKGKSDGKKKTSSAVKAGLQFSPARMTRYLRRHLTSSRISPSAGVYMAAVIEYLSAEILELAGNAAKEQKRTRITPRHIMIAVRGDEELNKYVEGNITHGGVMPFIHRQLLSKEQKKREAAGK